MGMEMSIISRSKCCFANRRLASAASMQYSTLSRVMVGTDFTHSSILRNLFGSSSTTNICSTSQASRRLSPSESAPSGPSSSPLGRHCNRSLLDRYPCIRPPAAYLTRQASSYREQYQIDRIASPQLLGL